MGCFSLIMVNFSFKGVKFKRHRLLKDECVRLKLKEIVWAEDSFCYVYIKDSFDLIFRFWVDFNTYVVTESSDA